MNEREYEDAILNENVAYVIQCAKEVGIEVTDETALNFSLIAEIMRRMKEQSISRKLAIQIAEQARESGIAWQLCQLSAVPSMEHNER